MLEQADPRIAALTLERLVKRSLELRGSAGMETSGSDSNNIKDSNGLGSGGVGLAAPAVCHQHRLEANVKAMREILDALVAAASPSIAQQRLDTIQAQVQIYSDWVDQQKLRQTVDHHQRKELQDRSELHQETGAESVDAATADKASQLRAQLLKLPRFPLRQRIPAQSKDTPDASQPHSPQEPRTSFPDAQLRLEARRSLLGRDSQTKDDTTDAAAASVGTNSTALAAILERNRREQGMLSDDLAMQAQRLKQNSLLFQDKMKADSKVISDVDEKLGDSLLRLQRERRGIRALTSRSWTTTFMLWGSLLLVVLLFMWALFVSRLVSPVRSAPPRHAHTHTHTHTHTPTPAHDHNDRHHDHDHGHGHGHGHEHPHIHNEASWMSWNDDGF